MTDQVHIGHINSTEIPRVLIPSSHPWIEFKQVCELIRPTDEVIWKIADVDWLLIDDSDIIHPRRTDNADVYDIMFRDDYVILFKDFLIDQLKQKCQSVTCV